MPNELLVNQLEEVLTELTVLGGKQEITTLVPSLIVIDATPTGLTDYIIIEDSRDGDHILALKVPGVLYANNDLVNVLFVEGTEPIAFQQANQSSGSAVAVSKLVSPDEAIDPVFSADNSGDVTLAGAGSLIIPLDIIHSGDINNKITFTDDVQTYTVGGEVLLTLTEAGQDVVKIGDGGDVDINFNDQAFLRGSDGNFGIGTTSVASRFTVSDTSNLSSVIQNTGDNTATRRANLNFAHSNGTGSFMRGERASGNDDGMKLIFATQPIGGSATISMTILENGDVGIFQSSPAAQLDVNQSSGIGAQPVLLLEQNDDSEEMIEFVGTIGVGNAIEAVGAKVLTVTHFVKVTLPGGLTRYGAYGTIA